MQIFTSQIHSSKASRQFKLSRVNIKYYAFISILDVKLYSTFIGRYFISQKKKTHAIRFHCLFMTKIECEGKSITCVRGVNIPVLRFYYAYYRRNDTFPNRI